MSVPETLREVFAIAGDAPMLLRNARIPLGCAPDGLAEVSDGLIEADIALTGGRIGRVAPPGELPVSNAEHDLKKSIVWPCPIRFSATRNWPISATWTTAAGGLA